MNNTHLLHSFDDRKILLQISVSINCPKYGNILFIYPSKAAGQGVA